ncbi:MAG: hypothetical protein KF734_17480 [Saprospiraceae bacterium]|nr:hypothetical protein [Saprospiraceae bacterium]
MKNNHFRTAYSLSWLIVVLAVVASLGGLFIDSLYRDSDFIKNAWFTNDWVTLVVASPALLVAMQWARRGAQRAQLIWMGLLLYMLYNYAFYLFGAAFNAFFLLYVALFTLSAYALIFGLSRLDADAIASNFSEKKTLPWIVVFLIFLAAPLLLIEGGQSIRFVFTGIVPEAPSLIFALDLSFVVPATILAAVWLWQRKAWGFVLGAMMLVKGTTYGLVLSTAALRLVLTDAPQKDEFLPFYLFVAIGSAVSLTVLLRHLNPNKR